MADSSANAGSVRMRKRLQQGVSIGGTYTFSSPLTMPLPLAAVPPWLRRILSILAAERGLSSFDQRHNSPPTISGSCLSVTTVAGWRAVALGAPFFGDWQWSGDWTIASGLPFTPRVLGDFADVNRGTNGTLRADVVPGTVDRNSRILRISEWFNTAAFVAPPSGQYGDARRNSIDGPGTLLFDMAFTKLFPLRESRMIELRAQVSNIFNHPSSARSIRFEFTNFGQVTAVGAMRAIQLTATVSFLGMEWDLRHPQTRWAYRGLALLLAYTAFNGSPAVAGLAKRLRLPMPQPNLCW